MKYLFPVLLVALVSSCVSVSNLADATIDSGHYDLVQDGSEETTRVYLDVDADSLTIIPMDENGAGSDVIKPAHNQIFKKQSFDVDVLTVPFKFRPALENLPHQVTADLNGNIFLGYRLDRHRTNYVQTPARMSKKVHHQAFTVGVFGGFGGTPVNPSTTSYQTTDEYSGLVLSRGFSMMMGIKSLTVGVALGWDYLADRDKDIWIYQNKGWYGLALSLNLN